MDVLYVTGSCLTKNTSANMSHNAFIQGLLENECNVDIVMAEDSWGKRDSGLPLWNAAQYFIFPSITLADRLRSILKGNTINNDKIAAVSDKQTENSHHFNLRIAIRVLGKKIFYTVFKPDPLYPLEKKWLKKAGRFRSKKYYDIVISNSSPAASHCLVAKLNKEDKIHFNRWIQIWEDPWYHDLYGGHSQKIEKEEHRLLREAFEIVYVSPLTLLYQKKYYSDCARKMSCIPLPAFGFVDKEMEDVEEVAFGYFGDYYSQTRNLYPFYEAVRKMNYCCYIFGDSDLSLLNTDKITVSGRVTLDELQTIQNKTTILVQLCNLRGGQIPGKIYHYSITDKPILFILDGSEEEKIELINYFKPFNRYYFSENNEEEIIKTMKKMVREKKHFSAIKEFMPKEVVRELLM